MEMFNLIEETLLKCLKNNSTANIQIADQIIIREKGHNGASYDFRDLPYSGKFSRMKIFAKWLESPQKKCSQL